MNFAEYQIEARKTALYDQRPASESGLRLIYPGLGLAGESGEVCEKIKKLFRDKGGIVTDEFREMLTFELGDVLWYLANIAADADISFEKVAEMNIEKLKSRRERGKIHGEGDNR